MIFSRRADFTWPALRFLSQRYSSRPVESDPRKHRGPPKQSIVQPKGTVLKLSGINGL